MAQPKNSDRKADETPAATLSMVASNVPETPKETPKICTQCKGPLNTTGYPLWCQSCRNAYQREQRALANYRMDVRSFAAGAQEMREKLAAMFEQTGSAVYSAREVALIIRRTEPPKLLGVADSESST